MKKHFSLPKLLLLGLTAAFALSAVSCKDDDKKKTPSGGDDITDTDVPTPARTVVFENETPQAAYLFTEILTDSQGRVKTLRGLGDRDFDSDVNIYYLDDNTVALNVMGISFEGTLDEGGMLTDIHFRRVVKKDDVELKIKSLADLAALDAVDEKEEIDEAAEYYAYEITGYAHYDGDHHLTQLQFAVINGDCDHDKHFIRNENYDEDVVTISYTWADGNLLSCQSESYRYDDDAEDYKYFPETTVSYTYGITPNKGNVMLVENGIAYDSEMTYMAYLIGYYAGLLGKSSAYLPEALTYTVTYEGKIIDSGKAPLVWGLDDAGYPYVCVGGEVPAEFRFSSTPDEWTLPELPETDEDELDVE